jgi:hypothetical protein
VEVLYVRYGSPEVMSNQIRDRYGSASGAEQEVRWWLSRLGLRPDTSSGELRSCSTLGAYLQDKFDLPTSL